MKVKKADQICSKLFYACMWLKMLDIFIRCNVFLVLGDEKVMDKEEEPVETARNSPQPEESTAGINVKYRNNTNATQTLWGNHFFSLP